jgi:hypothetical protein
VALLNGPASVYRVDEAALVLEAFMHSSSGRVMNLPAALNGVSGRTTQTMCRKEG